MLTHVVQLYGVRLYIVYLTYNYIQLLQKYLILWLQLKVLITDNLVVKFDFISKLPII